MIQDYSISEVVKNVYALLLTKIFYPQCRLLRRPIYIRGRKSIVGAKKLTTGYACRFDLNGKKQCLYIGDNCQFGDNTHIVASDDVRIGNNVLAASNVFISDTSHGIYKGENQSQPIESPNLRPLYYEAVEIGDDVWLGQNVVVLPGSKIGKGCIIGANAVVSRCIPDYSIVIQNNKIIKRYDSETKRWKSDLNR